VSEDVERYLADVEAAEPGRFTVDPVRQRELLAELGLSDPDLGFLKLAQAAVMSGAAARFSGRDNTIRFEMPLREAPAAPWWTGTNYSGWRGALASGLLTLSSRYEVGWCWQLGEQTRAGAGMENDFADQEAEVPNLPPDWFFCLIRDRKPGWFRKLSSSIGSLLTDRLLWGSQPIYWIYSDGEYGKSLTRLLGGGDFYSAGEFFVSQGCISRRAEAFVYCTDSDPGDLWLPEKSLAKSARYRCPSGTDESVQASPATTGLAIEGRGSVYRGWAVLGKTNKSWSEVTFVVNGVTLPPERNLLDRPGIVAYVSAAGLKTDLSGLQLVHDEAFRERLEMLKPEVRWLDSLR
jgi:hypothetical protein